jgi:hypothetical protein
LEEDAMSERRSSPWPILHRNESAATTGGTDYGILLQRSGLSTRPAQADAKAAAQKSAFPAGRPTCGVLNQSYTRSIGCWYPSMAKIRNRRRGD